MQRFRIGLAGLVTGVWFAGYILAYKSHTSPPTELSGLMAVVMGWAFAGQLRDGLKRSKDDEGKDDEDES